MDYMLLVCHSVFCLMFKYVRDFKFGVVIKPTQYFVHILNLEAVVFKVVLYNNKVCFIHRSLLYDLLLPSCRITDANRGGVLILRLSLESADPHLLVCALCTHAHMCSSDPAIV